MTRAESNLAARGYSFAELMVAAAAREIAHGDDYPLNLSI